MLTVHVLFLFYFQCSVGQGVDAMYKELYNRTTTKLMIIGPGCSTTAEAVGEAAARWNLLQVCGSIILISKRLLDQ